MKKFIKYIAIIFVVILTLTAFAGCDASQTSKPKEISASTYELNKSKVIKDYVPKDYDSIEDYSIYNKYEVFSICEDKMTDPLNQEETVVVESKNSNFVEHTLDVKRIGEDVFVTMNYYNKYSYNNFIVVNDSIKEREIYVEEKKFYQTGKDDIGYYIILNYSYNQVEPGSLYMSSYDNYQYFSSKEEYVSYICNYLQSGVGSYYFDQVSYSNYNYNCEQISKGVELSFTEYEWDKSENNLYENINTYNAKHVTDGIYTQSTSYVRQQSNLESIDTSSIVVNVEYKAKYDRVKFDIVNYIEGYIIMDSVINNSHPF